MQATGQGQPPAPESQIEVPKPPLKIQTARGTYIIDLLWEPDPIQVGQPTKFGLIFTDAAGGLANSVRYGFKATESDGTVLADLKNQKADDGTGMQQFTFEKEGPKDIEVTVEAVGGTPMGDFVESSTFNIVVVPPAGVSAATTNGTQAQNASAAPSAG
jgi:hypothetical protein